MQFIFLASLLLVAASATSGEIAFTFDDIPTGDSVMMTGAERTNKIVKALKDAAVPDALFFVKTNSITAKNKSRLQRYISHGYHLANHSHSHESASKMSTQFTILDIGLAHKSLQTYNNVLPYYRFPYLHYGKDRQSIDEIQTTLTELNYQNGYVTIDNYEWYMNSLLLQAKEAGKEIDYGQFGEVYVRVIWQTIAFYDNIAKTSLGRSPKHVLLLHENDTSALYLPKLIQHIRDQGWSIISPQEAYQDPIAKAFPKTKFLNQGRVAALAHDHGIEIKNLIHPTESQEYLDRLFEKENVFQ